MTDQTKNIIINLLILLILILGSVALYRISFEGFDFFSLFSRNEENELTLTEENEKEEKDNSGGLFQKESSNIDKRIKDSNLVSTVDQTRTVMTYICAMGGCSNFNCKHKDMVALCNEISEYSYKGKKPTINSGEDDACIFVPLNKKNGNTWYCADYTGVANEVDIYPGDSGYCSGSSYVCPNSTEYNF